MSRSSASRSWRFPAALSLLLGTVIFWQVSTAHMARGFLVPGATLIWLIAMAFWWAASPRPGRGRRLIAVGSVVAIFAAASAGLLRHDGSVDGTARPRFRWRWQSGVSRALPGVAETSPAQSRVMPPGAQPWPRFMGADGDGSVPEFTWSSDWQSTPPREVWRIPIGEGWSGFAIAEGRAVTLEQRGEQECVTCYQLTDGTLLWLHQEPTRFEENMGGPGPRSTPTLAPELGLVFALGANGTLNALDLATGLPRWQRNVLADSQSKNLMYAKASSPLLHDHRVIVSGGKDGATLCAYAVADGQLLWSAGSDTSAYSSPVIRHLAGRDQLVSVNQASVTGHDPATGALLWRFEWPGDLPKVCQPIPAGPDRLLVSSGYGMKSHLLEIQARDSGFQARALWSGSVPRTKFSSASVVGDQFYALDEGTLVCGRLADGSRVWRSGRYGYGQHLLCGRDLLLIQSEPGAIALVRADPAGLRELARLDALNSKTWNPPALAGRWLLARNDREAVCFELPAAP